MPTFASGGNTDLSYMAEVTYGTTPAIPSFQLLPYSSVTLGEARTEIDDSTRRGDRMRRQKYQGNSQVVGDVVAPLMHGNFDPLLESLFRGAFVANVLKPGNTVKSLSMERMWNDITLYQLFKGVEVNSLTLAGALDAEVQATFNLIGQSSTDPSATSIDTTPTVVTEKKAFINVGGTIKEGGSLANISSFNINIDNGLNPNYTWGNRDVANTSSALIIVTGDIEVYFENATLMNKFRNGTSSTLQVLFSDGTNSITLDLNTIQYTVATQDDASADTLTLNMNFEALYNATDAANIKVTRS